MSEIIRSPYFTRLSLGAAAALLSLTMNGCSEETTDTGGGGGGGTTGETPGLCDMIKDIDADCDGVLDANDQLPNRADMGDDDQDYVPNVFDTFAGFDDMKFDSDGDGLIDAYDSFYGNNLVDDDQDGLINGIDAAPYSSEIQQTVSAEQVNLQLNNQIVKNSMANDAFIKYLEIDTTMPILNTQNAYNTDSDGDYYMDAFDTEPYDGYVTPENDAWDPSSDSYWQEDPWDS